MFGRQVNRQRTILHAFLLILFSLFYVNCTNIKQKLTDPTPISDELQNELEAWLDENGRAPDTYVASLFAEHDVVILGEQHRIKHDVEFVASMIAPLHASGVQAFATEFARRSDQHLLDSLMEGEEWDESLAREIIFNQFMAWGFQEYVDILHAAWQVNRDREDNAPQMRVIGLNNTLDFSHFKSEADRQNDEIWKLVLDGQTEADWAQVVLDVVGEGQKVLVHCGIHHAFTGYNQPKVIEGEFTSHSRTRMGNVLRDSLGMSAVTIYLHAPWNTTNGYDADFIHPAGGRLDAFMLSRSNGPYPVGFDVADSPLAPLMITDAVYSHGYHSFTISDFCDGWIYTKPVNEFETVTYIDGWINESNLAQAQATAMNPHWRRMEINALNDGCKSYRQDFYRFFGQIK
jgi:hypothetical protein